MKHKEYQTFLKEVVDQLKIEPKSMSNSIYMKIELDESYTCSDDDLGKYFIHYDYPLHLIHLGIEMNKIEQRLDESTKKKWFIKDSI